MAIIERRQARVVDNHDFANGTAMVGGSLDLPHAAEPFGQTCVHEQLLLRSIHDAYATACRRRWRAPTARHPSQARCNNQPGL